jgi:hypothetical protein
MREVPQTETVDVGGSRLLNRLFDVDGGIRGGVAPGSGLWSCARALRRFPRARTGDGPATPFASVVERPLTLPRRPRTERQREFADHPHDRFVSAERHDEMRRLEDEGRARRCRRWWRGLERRIAASASIFSAIATIIESSIRRSLSQNRRQQSPLVRSRRTQSYFGIVRGYGTMSHQIFTFSG